MADERDKYFIDLEVEQADGLSKMEAMAGALERLRRRRTQLRQEHKKGLVTDRQLSKEMDRLNVQIKGLSSRYREASNAAAGLTKQGIRFRDKIAGAMTRSLANLGAAFAGAFAISRVQEFVRKSVKLSAELSDSIADVQKTTGLTEDAVKGMDAAFQNLDTRTSRTELLNLAQVAGRLNIEGTENIQQFVEEANQIQVALGDVLGEGAALKIGKAAASYRESILGIGSAINELGNTSRAQEDYIAEFLSRLQGSASAANVSAADIAAYGATLDSFGLKVESSSTALSKFFLDFVQDTAKFESAAGIAEGALGDLIGTQGTNEGFLFFIESLKNSTNSQQEFLDVMETVGVTGKRASETFLTIANNIEEVRRNQTTANKALQDGTSITAEYEIRNNNLAASIDKLNKSFEQLQTGDAATSFYQTVVDLSQQWLDLLNGVEKSQDRVGKEQSELVTAGSGTGFMAELNRTLAGLAGVAMMFQDTEQSVEDLNTQIYKRTQELKDLEAEALQQTARFGTTTLGPRIDELKEQIKELKAALSGDFSLISLFDPVQSLGTPSGSSSTSGTEDDPEVKQQSILEKLREQIAALKEQRDLVTESSGGRSKILNLTSQINQKEKELNALLTITKARTKSIEENIGGWAKGAQEYIELTDSIAARDQIGIGFDSEAEGDEFINEEIDARIEREKLAAEQIAADKIAEEEKVVAKRKELETQALNTLQNIGSQLVASAMETANRRLTVELDLLEKLRQNNEISQEEYERLTTEARKRQFEETKRLRTVEAVMDLAVAYISALKAGPVGLAQAALIAAQGAAQIAIIQSQQFAKGGKVQDLGNGRITAQPNIPRQSNGDSVLATVKPGELILNKNQQDALGGAQTFAKIGVPGFATGGLVAPRANTPMGVPAERIDYAELAGAFANIRIETSVQDILSGIGRQNRIQQLKTL